MCVYASKNKEKEEIGLRTTDRNEAVMLAVEVRLFP